MLDSYLRLLAVQLLRALDQLHRNGILHRDLKPDNLVVDWTPAYPTSGSLSSSDVPLLRVIDFGMASTFDVDSLASGARACTLGKGGRLWGGRGTHGFVAPEIFSHPERGCSEKCDLFSVGVTLYFLVFGTVPFPGEGMEGYRQSILRLAQEREGRFTGPECHPRSQNAFVTKLSEEAQDFFKQVLAYKPEYRCSIKEALNHPFITRQVE
jgi:serine/threonine protein kinase